MTDLIPYFAYGHNTNINEMHARAPSAKLVGHADLPDYRLVMDEYANIEPAAGHSVHGVLWLISHDDLKRLDDDEAYAEHYRHATVRVMHRGKNIPALTYRMLNRFKTNLPPSKQYISFIAKGYRQNNIPLSQLIAAVERRLAQLKRISAQ